MPIMNLRAMQKIYMYNHCYRDPRSQQTWWFTHIKKNMKPQTQHITPHKYRKFHGYPSTWLANSQDKRTSHHTKQWKHHIQLQTYANTNPVHYPQAQSPHPWGAANASPGHCAAADCWCVGKASWWTLGSSHWNQKVSKGKWRCRGSWLWFYMV